MIFGDSLTKELTRVGADLYNRLESTAKLLDVSPEDLLEIFLESLDLIGEVIESEASKFKDSLGLSGRELASFIVGRSVALSVGLYGMVLVLDSLIGAWSKGFAFTHGSGRVVDESGNVRGLLIHLDSTEVSIKKSLVDCIELLVHDEGVAVGFHSNLLLSELQGEEKSRIKEAIERSLESSKERSSALISRCGEGCEVDVDVIDHEDGFTVGITFYLKRFNCIPRLEDVDPILAKLVDESGLTKHVEDVRGAKVASFLRGNSSN